LEHYIIKKPDMGITKKETRTTTSPVVNRQTLQLESWKAQQTYGQDVPSQSHARILASRKAGIEAPVEAQCSQVGANVGETRERVMLQSESQSGFRVRGGDRGD